MKKGLAPRLLAANLLRGVIEKRVALPSGSELAKTGSHAFLARALASAALRHFGQSEAALRQGLLRNQKNPPKALRRIRFALHIATAELLFLRRAPHAAVFLGVEAVRTTHPDLVGLANALLRRVEENRTGLAALPARLNCPDWLAESWQRDWGEDRLQQIIAAHTATPPRPVITLKNPQQSDLFAQKLGAKPLICGDLALGQLQLASAETVETLNGYAEGAWWVQDVAAAWPARLFGKVKNLAVLDLCAAPGGKAAQLAAAGANLTAFEIDPARRELLQANFRRLKLTAHFPESFAKIRQFAPKQGFDAVLIDAPCMGTGTLRRHPDLAYIRRPQDLPRLLRLQHGLLRQGAELLKPDGQMVYSVCSLERAEGEGQIENFLSKTSFCALHPITPAETGGVAEFLSQGQFRSWPCADPESQSMDGFYAARLIRRA